MKKILIVILLVIPSSLFSQSYLKKENNVVKIGNSYIERVVSLSENNFGTIEIINKRSGKVYKTNSNEFGLQVVFSSIGPAIGKQQNGENPSYITNKDFTFNGYEEINLNSDSKGFSLNFVLEGYQIGFVLTVNYEISPEDFYVKKWIVVKDTSYGIHFLDKIFVEDLKFENNGFSHGQFGQPVLSNDIFLGVEYPEAENIIGDHNVKIGYVVGRKINNDLYKSYPSVIGASVSSEKLEQTFLSYIDRIKVNGKRPYLLYNSWYDFRNPAIAEDSASIMNENNVLQRINTFKQYLFNKYDISLNAFILDDGWDNYKSIWEIDTVTLPNKFTPFVNALKQMNTSLGIWASPFGGYSNRDIRVNWAKEHGYETVADFYCFAGTKYKTEFKKRMLDYTKKYNLGYFKWDGFLLSCNQPGHGHLPAVYSTAEYIDTFIDLMESVRKINPDIFINITVGTWLSPWWLKYANSVWMQGEDYAYAEEVPSINARDKSITYRDAVLYKDFSEQNLIFPVSNLMTHGIIKGRLNFLGGKNESLYSFSNEVMMYFGRGVMMWELYVSPELLSVYEWESIASTIKWADTNKNILANTKMIFGNPLKREVYGYIHFTKEKGILLLRNPDVNRKEIELKLTDEMGDIDSSKEYYLKVFYPYNYVFGQKIKPNQSITIPLNSYEVLAGEFIPVEEINQELPVNSRYEIQNGKLKIFRDYGFQGIVRNIKSEKLLTIDKSEDNKINFNENNVTKNSQEFSSNIKVNILPGYKGSKLGILLEPENNLLDEYQPEAEIKINGKVKKLVVEQENGKWFWMLSDLNEGENNADVKIEFSKNTNYKISSWILSDYLMEGKTVEISNESDSEILPVKPYPANIKKITKKISSYDVK